jgi:hypothetical protein
MLPIFILVFYSSKAEEYLQLDGVISKKPVQLKKKCCDKYIKKGKRCKRCPCLDLL